MAGRIIYVNCMQCFREDMSAGGVPQSISTTYKLQNINNEVGNIEFTCEKGHKNVILIQELNFETLLNVAIEDSIYRYYREAVFNLAAAQERFFEFVVELLCIEKELSQNEYDKMWKFFSSQSERQLGAFCALYFCRFGKVPFDYKKFTDIANIRNNVIHKGKVPTKEEAYAYGNYVIENIYNIMKDVLENVEPKLLFELQSKKIKEKTSNIPQGACVTTVCDSVLSWRTATYEDLARERKLQEYSSRHTEAYANMAHKANEAGKILDVNDKGELILIEPIDIFEKKQNAEYIGKRTIEEYMLDVGVLKQNYDMVEKASFKGFKVVDLTRV